MLECLERIGRLSLRFLLSGLDALIDHAQKAPRRSEPAPGVLASTDQAVEAWDLLQRHLQSGKVARALGATLTLVSAAHLAILSASALAAARGRKVLEASAAGGRARALQQASRRAEYRQEFEAHRRRAPTMSKRSLYAAIGRRLAVSPSTIRYHIERG